MSRKYVPMRVLFASEQPLSLSNESPSGLIWKKKYRNKMPGDIAGCYDKVHDRYVLVYKGWRVAAHRVVYYLRTGIDPVGADVIYGDLGEHKGQDLVLTQAWQPKKQKKTVSTQLTTCGDS